MDGSRIILAAHRGEKKHHPVHAAQACRPDKQELSNTESHGQGWVWQRIISQRSHGHHDDHQRMNEVRIHGRLPENQPADRAQRRPDYPRDTDACLADQVEHQQHQQHFSRN